jgi:hypothetical protein
MMVGMWMAWRSLVPRVMLAVIAIAVSACAGNPLTSPTEFDSLSPGWQSKFSIDWQVAPSPDGTNLLYGRITSHWGQFASRFRVLAMAMDSSGKVFAQRIEWVPSGVPGFTSTYFEIGHLPVAASYRVTVWDYTILEAPGAIQ